MKKQALKYLAITTLGLAALAGANGAVYAETMDYQVDAEQALQVTIPLENVNISLNPSTNPFDTGDIPVTVATNNPTGYHIGISADGTNMIEIHDNTKTIPTLPENEGGYTQETFEANRWGYRIAPGNYRPFVSDTPIGGGDGPTNGDVTNVTFASKVDFLQPTGSYQIAVNFTVVANPTLMVIQDLDPAYCTETPLYVMDARDGEEYMIQRLADGKCWMLDNMRLDPTQVPLAMLQGNTNAPDKALEYFKNGGGNGQKYAVEGVKLETESNWWSNTYKSPSVRTVEKDNVLDTPGIGSGKVGVIYNYCALSAGTYCYENFGYFGNNVYDICPSGWRVPTGKDNGDYGNLYDAVKVYDVYDSGSYLNYQKSGLAFRTALNLPEDAIYWTSTFSSYYNEMYVLSTGRTDPNLGEDKDNQGMRPIRCIMEERTLSDITYMQDVTKRIIKNTPDETTVTLTDYRDNQEYTIVKDTALESDYNHWDPVARTYPTLEHEVALMTRNLAIGCDGEGGTYGTNAKETTLIPATSNLPTSWTTPTADLADNGGNDDRSSRLHCDSVSGAYYNFYTAMADTAPESTQKYTLGSSTVDRYHRTYIGYDICPAGWRLLGTEVTGSIYTPGNPYNYWIIKYADAFAAQLGDYGTGYYNYFWWTTFPMSAGSQNVLRYNASSSEGIVRPMSGIDWWGSTPGYYIGSQIRCVAGELSED